jgi:hypothetical protein
MLTLGALMRDAGAAKARRQRGPSRLGLAAKQRRELELPAYLADFRLIPGICRRRRCKSRYGVVRLSLDYRDRDRIDRFATVECAACGKTWRRTREPRLGEYQSCRLTLILPHAQRRYYARKRWHVEGDDAIVIRDATQSDLMAASGDWHARNERRQAARVRLAERKAAAERETNAHTVDLLARLAAWDAEHAAAESEAASRD